MPYNGLTGSINDFDDGVIVGTQNNVTLVDTPDGMGVAFGTGTDSRIEYSYADGFPRSGTFEITVKVDGGFAYQNGRLNDTTSAYIFGTDISGGDVTWPGSMWLRAGEDGSIRFAIANAQYAGQSREGTFILAEDTDFSFGEWHTISISYGSEGMALALDGTVLGTTSNTQTLAGGGTHSQSLGQPTIGEPRPSFWSEDQWEGGFEGVVEAVRISDQQNDFVLADATPDPVSYASTDALFAEGGKHGFLAELSLAAYHLEREDSPQESLSDQVNWYNPRAEETYADLPEGFVLLDAGGDQTANLGAYTGNPAFPRDGFHNGIYTHENGAALVGRSDDALFIAFRGTNGPSDIPDWVGMQSHFDLFTDLFDLLGIYIEENPELTDLYITGHSLGGAMVEGFTGLFGHNFYGLDVESLTFASPGFNSGSVNPDNDEALHENWSIKGDAVPGVAVAPFGTTKTGDINTIHHNTLEKFAENIDSRALGGGATDLHSMNLYALYIAFYEDHGVDGSTLANGIDYKNFYTNAQVINVPAQNYVIGGDRDEITGSSFKDAIFGGLQNDTLNGTGGDDYIDGGRGADSLKGGNQEDYILGGRGKDTILGGKHDDDLFGNGKSDSLNGGKGQDRLHGDAGQDTLFGHRGQDTLYGGAGADELNGGRHDDTLYGGKGSDDFIFENNSADDVILDFKDDKDTIWLDADLWFFDRTVNEVLSRFGQIVDGNAVLTFGLDSLTILNVSSLSILEDDISIL